MPHTDMGDDLESVPNTPRWVKVIGIIIAVIILLMVILHLSGHSPMGHGAHTAPGAQMQL